MGQYKFGFVMLWIFDLFPRLYRLLRPGGVQTIKQYSETASEFECFPEVLDDLCRLEKLWHAYPEGLSNDQLTEYSEGR